MVTFDETKSNKKISELYKKEGENLAIILSKKYGLKYVDLSRVSVNTDAFQLINEDTAKTAEIVIFNKVGKKLSIAVRSPNKEETIAVIKGLEERGYLNTLFMASSNGIEHAILRYRDLSHATETKAGILDISEEDIRNILNELKNINDAKNLIDNTLSTKKAYRISHILEIVLSGGIASKASDVHIEPEETFVRLRYRLDGILVEVTKIDTETYGLLLARIKLTSGLKLNIKNKPQDGRFSIHIDQKNIEVRTSVLPGAYGESIVLRILDPDTISLTMENLGVENKLFAILEKEIVRPNGMILTTGPTGSGKTTTLYGFLKKTKVAEKKIITIEDPIEYHLEGIVQTQVDEKNYTFENGLRSALRQDPDVIMVGEIRDKNVASTAINAALTGHLVFSTLHTNNAAGSFPRLVDLGVNPKIISSAVNIVLAQRLVRKLCESCKKKIAPNDKQKEIISKILSTIKSDSDIPKNISSIWSATGCDVCNNTGYSGRLGVFEAILMNGEIEKLVKQSASEREISDAATDQGILSMKQDGILKVLRGTTSIEELERVVGVL